MSDGESEAFTVVLWDFVLMPCPSALIVSPVPA